MGIFDLSGSCACCTAQPALRALLPRVLRAGPWDRLIVELAGPGLPQQLADALRDPAWRPWLTLEETVLVVDAGRPAPYLALDDPAMPVLTSLLVRAQVESADRVWVRTGTGVSAPVGPGSGGKTMGSSTVHLPSLHDDLVEKLGRWRPFGRPVLPFPGDAPCDGLPGREAAGVQWSAGLHPGRRPIWLPREPVARAWDSAVRVWPPGAWADRRRVSRLLSGLMAAPDLHLPAELHLRLVLAGEREVGYWQWEPAEAGWFQDGTAYRSDNRMEIAWPATDEQVWLPRFLELCDFS